MGGIAKVVTEIGNIIEEENHCSYYLSASGNPSNYYEIPDSKLTIPEKEVSENKYEKLKNKVKKFVEMKLHNDDVDLSNYLQKQQKNIEQFIYYRELDYLIVCRYDLSFLILKLKKKFPNLKIIIWIHGPVEIYTQKKERKKYLYYYRQNLLESDNVVCLTNSDLQELNKIDTNINCTKIYNPISYKKIEPTEFLKREKSILCVSRLDIRDKGIDSLIKLADRLPKEWRIKLVGTGNESELKEFDNLISKMKNRDKLEYLGSKKTNELKNIYQTSAIFVSPSLYEGFGLTLVEAMNFGLPIVTFETSGAREVTEDGKFGILVKNFSFENLVDECLHLIKNEDCIKKYTQLSYLRSNSFNIENIKKQWLSLFKD